MKFYDFCILVILPPAGSIDFAIKWLVKWTRKLTIFSSKTMITITSVIICKINALSSILTRIIPTIIQFNPWFNQLKFGVDQLKFGIDQLSYFRETFAFCHRKKIHAITAILLNILVAKGKIEWTLLWEYLKGQRGIKYFLNFLCFF